MENYSYSKYADIHVIYGPALGNSVEARRIYSDTFPNRSLPRKTFKRVKQVTLQSSSSPRRVAVPVLVKDGKPCSGSSNQTSSSSSNGQSNAEQSRSQQSSACQSSQAQAQCMANSGLAMAYGRQQTNYQQQCSAYLPLQARAW